MYDDNLEASLTEAFGQFENQIEKNKNTAAKLDWQEVKRNSSS